MKWTRLEKHQTLLKLPDFTDMRLWEWTETLVSPPFLHCLQGAADLHTPPCTLTGRSPGDTRGLFREGRARRGFQHPPGLTGSGGHRKGEAERH